MSRVPFGNLTYFRIVQWFYNGIFFFCISAFNVASVYLARWSLMESGRTIGNLTLTDGIIREVSQYKHVFEEEEKKWF